MSTGAEQAEAPLCPWCGAPWTATMLAQLASQISAVFCACCAGEPGPRHVTGPMKLPTQDLCCEACGKPIYRAPVPSSEAARDGD